MSPAADDTPLARTRTGAAARAVEAFARLHGGAPKGVWSAPGRVNVIGEHTDYNEGFALPVTIPQRTYAAARPRTDGILRMSSGSLAGRPDSLVEVPLERVRRGVPGGWAAYVAGVAAVLREEGHDVPGLDVRIESDVPVGAGLSSSAALECAVLVALCDLLGVAHADDADRRGLARLARRAENDVVGAPTGGLDQQAVMRCGAGALVLDCRDDSAADVPFDLREHGHALLVVDTRVHHELTDGGYGSRRAQCEEAAKALGVTALRDATPDDVEALDPVDGLVRRRARHVVRENERVHAAADELRGQQPGHLTRLGELFLASHASLRDDFEVSCPELDAVVEFACAAGALGARMTGGGFGGSAIAIVPDARLGEVAEAVRRRFHDRGWAEPHLLSLAEGGGAARREDV